MEPQDNYKGLPPKDDHPLQNPDLPQAMPNIFKMPYHQLASFHLDSQESLPDPDCFFKSMISLTADSFKNDDLQVKEDLDWETIQRFAVFRIWVAFNRFPDLETNIRAQYNYVIPMLN